MDILNSDCLSHKRSFDEMLAAPEDLALGLGNEADFFDSMGCDEVDAPEAALPILERPQLLDCDNTNNSPDYVSALVEKRAEVVAMADSIRRLKTRLAALQNKQARHCPSSPTAHQSQGAPSLSLRVNGAIESVWYADRDLPHFTIEVVDPLTNAVCTHLLDVKIEVTLRDGKGKDATNKLTASRNSSSSPSSSSPSSPFSPSSPSSPSSSSSSGCGHSLYFPVAAGSACVSGLRFTTVSSKCGGHFRLEFALVPAASSSSASSPPPILATFASAPVQVLSYRLFNCRKLSAEKLTPSDSVAKMKGIGALYAKRLAAINVCTVSALAGLAVNEEDGEGVVALLRRDRGGLTAAKLIEYVKQAREIVARHSGEVPNDASNNRPAKRARISPPSQALPILANVCGVPASPEVNKRVFELAFEQQPQQQSAVSHPAMCAAALAQAFQTPAALGF